ncbi:MAG TPA: GspH/FimT family pseudopilin [Planctomycetota bacterium]|nr:GspH/FimT family pseudopilin [Planctomycetota bacterium]
MRRAEAGFTLIELVAVCVLIGLLLAFAPHAFGFLLAEKELESEVSRLATTIDFVKSQAVLDQCAYAIHLDTETSSWAVQLPREEEQESPEPGKEPVKVLVLDEDLPPEELDWHKLPRGISLEFYEGRQPFQGRYEVTYGPDGSVPAHTLVLESNRVSSLDEADRVRTIRVSFTGLVSISPGRAVGDFKLTEAELGR